MVCTLENGSPLKPSAEALLYSTGPELDYCSFLDTNELFIRDQILELRWNGQEDRDLSITSSDPL